MKTYYLVLGQCDAYITHFWFQDKELAEEHAETVQGKEVIVEEIRADNLDVCFFDTEAIADRNYSKFYKHKDFDKYKHLNVGMCDNGTVYLLCDDEDNVTYGCSDIDLFIEHLGNL